MVNSFFRSEDEQNRVEVFNQKWKEYIERTEGGITNV